MKEEQKYSSINRVKEYINDDIFGSSYDIVSDIQSPIMFPAKEENKDELRLLSLFSGCGGMDIGFEGGFIANKKSLQLHSEHIEREINEDWVLVKKTKFRTVFANDILTEARIAWLNYMRRFNYDYDIYRTESIVDLVKMQKNGIEVFPRDVDIVTGGFPCQDFSVAGKRLGFNSSKDDKGRKRKEEKPSEENRGKLYYWMKQVIDITRPIKAKRMPSKVMHALVTKAQR